MWIKKILLLIVGLYFVFLIFLYFVQEHLMFAPKKLGDSYQFNFSQKFEEHFIESSTGKKINYLVFKHTHPNGVILYFHGNAGALDSWGFAAEELSSKMGKDVWIFDYPGFGKSGVTFSQSGEELVTIGRELLSKIKETYSNVSIFLYGRSFGTGIASAIALEDDVTGVILETPYTSLTDLAKDMFPFAPSFLLKIKLDNKRLKSSSLRQILLIHGDRDQIIHINHSIYLADILAPKASLIKIPNGQHNNLSSFDLYWAGLAHYFSKFDSDHHQ